MLALNGGKRSTLHLATLPRGTSCHYPSGCRPHGPRAIVDAVAERNVVTMQKNQTLVTQSKSMVTKMTEPAHLLILNLSYPYMCMYDT